MGMTYNATSVVSNLSVQSVSGVPGASFYRFSFLCKAEIPAHEKLVARVHGFRCAVKVKATAPQELLLGEAFTENAVVLETKRVTQNTSLVFCLDLDALQVEKIEELRNGGDLRFRLSVSAVVQPVTTGGEALTAFDGDVSLQVNQRTWLDTLKSAQYGTFLLFEIPIPAEARDSELSQAVSNLGRAREHYLMGRYDEAVAGCRRTLESLAAGLGDEADIKRVRDSYFESRALREDMPVSSRVLFLREAVRHLAHPAAHGDVSGAQAHYNRHEAMLVLGLTATTLTNALSRLPKLSTGD